MHCFSSRVTSWLTWTLRVGGFVLRRRIGASVIRPSHLGWPTQQQRRSQEAVAVLWSQTIPWDRHRQIERKFCTIVGGVASPILANLFLHYAFDLWLARSFPAIPFERYADDIICHCRSEEEARTLWNALEVRFRTCGLVLHPTKTKLVYCKDTNRRGDYPVQSFDFLGYTFRPRKAAWRGGRYSTSFLPAASPDALKAIRQTIRRWAFHHRTDKSLGDLARMYRPYNDARVSRTVLGARGGETPPRDSPSLPDDRRPEALALAGRRPGWLRARRLARLEQCLRVWMSCTFVFVEL